MDKHCPAVKVRGRTKQSAPWFDANCREARRRTRRAERRFRRTCADADRQEWTKMIEMRAAYENKNNQFWRTEIAANSGNTNQLWKTLHGVLGVEPNDDSCNHNADDFAVFFTNKVDQVRAATASSPLYHVTVHTTPTLAEWTVITVAEVDRSSEQDVSVGPNTNVAGQGHARALVSVHVSVRQSASVPVQLLYPGRPGRNTSASACGLLHVIS